MRDFIVRISLLTGSLFKACAVEEMLEKLLYARDYSGAQRRATEK